MSEDFPNGLSYLVITYGPEDCGISKCVMCQNTLLGVHAFQCACLWCGDRWDATATREESELMKVYLRSPYVNIMGGWEFLQRSLAGSI